MLCDAAFLPLQVPKGRKLKDVQDAFAPFGFQQEDPAGWFIALSIDGSIRAKFRLLGIHLYQALCKADFSHVL